jgi:hypothetical protein
MLVAAALMAVFATAAEAIALGPANVTDRDPLGFTAAHHQLPVVSHSPGGPVVLHKTGFVLGHQLNVAPAQPMAPVPASAVDGFDWTAAAVGAFVASLVLILAAVAATIIRPRQTVQL